MILDEINVSYFKGIQELDIKFDKKISIIYGENGSGKSSIFEAMHLMFYFDKIKYIEIIGKTKVNFDEEVAFKDFETYTLAEAIRIDKAGLKKEYK